MENAYKLSEQLLDEINLYEDKYKTDEGKNITTETSIKALNDIIQKGFVLHNYTVEHKLYEHNPEMQVTLVELNKYMDKLAINKKNAENLQLSSAMQIWNQCKLLIAVLAASIIDTVDSKVK